LLKIPSRFSTMLKVRAELFLPLTGRSFRFELVVGEEASREALLSAARNKFKLTPEDLKQAVLSCFSESGDPISLTNTGPSCEDQPDPSDQLDEYWAFNLLGDSVQCLDQPDPSDLANKRVLEPHEKRIFLLRHGQGEHNVHGDHLPDPPLTALGCEQANWWAAEMPKIAQPEVVLLSPLTRALQTGLRAFQNCSTHFEVCRHAGEMPFDHKCNLPNQDLTVVRHLLESEPRGHEILALDGEKSHTGIPGTGCLEEGFTDLPETDWDSTLHGEVDKSRWLADRHRVHHSSVYFLVKELCQRQETTIAISAHNSLIRRIMLPEFVSTDNCEMVEAVLNVQTGQLTTLQRYECPWNQF